MEQPAGAVAEEQPGTEAVVAQLGTSEAVAEEQEYDASSVEYEDANASSISSSFAAYTDEEMNQKSQR